jgi:hypothetical protein
VEKDTMKRFSYFAMAALLTAGLSLPAMAQAKPASSQTKSAMTDPCQSQKDAVTKAGKDAKAKKTAQTDLKTCQDNQKKAKKKGGN